MEVQIFQERQLELKKSTYETKSLLAAIGFKHSIPMPNFYCKIERIKINE